MGSCCRLVVRPDINIMLRAGLVLLAVLCLALAEPQNNNRFRNNRNNRNNGNRPARQNRNRPNSNQFSRNGVTRNGARDAKGTEVYPGCSGKVCLPDAKLCAARKQQKGADSFRGKTYWYSWESNEAVLKNARWNWFTARNYCRKRCMDLISIESEEEQEFLGRAMNGGNVREVWTSGMGETNVFNGRRFNGWSNTGPLQKAQPDGILKADGFGEQACTALLDNFFNDGLSWHDTKCNDRRQIICEDLPVGNINFVRQQNPGVTIP